MTDADKTPIPEHLQPRDGEGRTAAARRLLAEGWSAQHLVERGYGEQIVRDAKRRGAKPGRPWAVRKFSGVSDVAEWIATPQTRPKRDLEAAVRFLLVKIERMRRKASET